MSHPTTKQKEMKMGLQMRKHQPTSTMRPPRIQRRSGQSDTMREYLDWRDVLNERMDALIPERRAEFAARFLRTR